MLSFDEGEEQRIRLGIKIVPVATADADLKKFLLEIEFILF